MSSPRQDVLSRMIINLEDAGFNVNFTSIYWIFATGFPKALNVSKKIDEKAGVEREVLAEVKQTPVGGGVNTSKGWKRPGHFNEDGSYKKLKILQVTKPETKEAKKFEGSYGGFQPKPALENIIVVQKPMSEKTYVEQVLKNGKGITWFDDCRIPINRDIEERQHDKEKRCLNSNYKIIRSKDSIYTDESVDYSIKMKQMYNKGRFPANILVQDDILSDGNNTGNSLRKNPSSTDNAYFGNSRHEVGERGYPDEGSFSRYFDLDSWAKENNIKDTFPFLIVPKPSRKEKEMGCEHLKKNKKYTAGNYSQSPICSTCNKTLNGTNDHSDCDGDIYYKDMESSNIDNSHPTVKSIKLMSYLITLASRKEDIILDPFCGSGTTCIAAKLLGRKYIGVELNKEYYDIAKTRLDNIDIQGELF